MAGIPIRWLAGFVLVAQVSCASTNRPESALVPIAAYDFTTEGSFPAPPEVPRIPTSLAKPSPAKHLAADSQVSALQGWRVQVFAGYSLQIAQNIQRELQSKRSEVVYIDLIEPYYKVRIGDCASRATCEELLRQLQSQGRESAWVVPSIIHR